MLELVVFWRAGEAGLRVEACRLCMEGSPRIAAVNCVLFFSRSLSEKTTLRSASFLYGLKWWQESAATLRPTPCVMSMLWSMPGSSSGSKSMYVPREIKTDMEVQCREYRRPLQRRRGQGEGFLGRGWGEESSPLSYSVHCPGHWQPQVPR